MRLNNYQLLQFSSDLLHWSLSWLWFNPQVGGGGGMSFSASSRNYEASLGNRGEFFKPHHLLFLNLMLEIWKRYFLWTKLRSVWIKTLLQKKSSRFSSSLRFFKNPPLREPWRPSSLLPTDRRTTMSRSQSRLSLLIASFPAELLSSASQPGGREKNRKCWH